jgi:hypothetical protein
MIVDSKDSYSRRRFFSAAGLGSMSTLAVLAGNSLPCNSTNGRAWAADDAIAKPATKAQIAITLDLEMSRNFPTWETTHWDYEKGNLDEAAKQYAVGAAQRVADAGGVIHFFVVGRVLEQANVDWLRELAAAGHPLGNHTYDHVNVTANRIEDVQFRFQRSPWLVAGQTVSEVIQQNIRLCSLAMQERLGIDKPVGFRTPGGFAEGLRNSPAIRRELLDQGYSWVSSLYPPHPNTEPGQKPNQSVIDGIVAAQAHAQPFRYDDGLIEIPMSPISDIGAFRTGKWRLSWFQDAVRQSIEWAIANRAAFDFLAHPSCLGVVDPDFKTIDMIIDIVRNAGQRAQLVSLETLTERAAH